MARGIPLEGAPGWRVIERPKRRPRRLSVIILGIAVGLLLATSAVHRYWAGWPDHVREAANLASSPTWHSRAPTPEASSVGERPEPQQNTEAAANNPPSTPSSMQILIHYPAGQGDAAPAMKLAALLQSHGFFVADIRLVDSAIEQSSVRYFFDTDRDRSRGLVGAINALLAEQAPQKASDFSHLSSKPDPGTVEIWLRADDRQQLALDATTSSL